MEIIEREISPEEQAFNKEVQAFTQVSEVT